jgi:hypothetical protein
MSSLPTESHYHRYYADKVRCTDPRCIEERRIDAEEARNLPPIRGFVLPPDFVPRPMVPLPVPASWSPRMRLHRVMPEQSTTPDSARYMQSSPHTPNTPIFQTPQRARLSPGTPGNVYATPRHARSIPFPDLGESDEDDDKENKHEPNTQSAR